MHVNDLLKMMFQRKSSDLHLKVGSPPKIRVDGELLPLLNERLTSDEMNEMIYGILNEKQKKQFLTTHELDFAYGVPGVSRFRVNCCMQRGTLRAVMRVVPFEVHNFDDLGLPVASMVRLSEMNGGLVLITGPTGCGKSTTLASVIEFINSRRNCHIVTVEDPIEFLYRDNMAIISQREIGSDTESFAAALRHVLRQDPDVILIGEMRDLETISTALTAAETGHLVLSTLHTTDAPHTIDRIVDVFPPHQQTQIRIQLASSLQGVVCQKLLPKVDGVGRMPATEVLIATPTIRQMILDAAPPRTMHEAILKSPAHENMHTMNQSLVKLVKDGLVEKDYARMISPNPDEFDLNYRGQYFGSGTVDKKDGRDDFGGDKFGGRYTKEPS